MHTDTQMERDILEAFEYLICATFNPGLCNVVSDEGYEILGAVKVKVCFGHRICQPFVVWLVVRLTYDHNHRVVWKHLLSDNLIVISAGWTLHW